MKIDTLNILAELERLGAAFPWVEVDLWAQRKPEGALRFTACVWGSSERGTETIWGHGDSPADAVNEAVKECEKHDPEIARTKKIAALKVQIAKLEAVVIGLPPYRPNRELAAGVLTVPETVDVGAKVEAQEVSAA